MGFAITNNQSEGRFEIACEEHLTFLEYKVTGTLMTFLHTEVPESLSGKGFGGKLVKFALEYAEQNNLDVVAQCEFAQSCIKRHKEYPPFLDSA